MKQVKAKLAKLLAEENITVRHNAKARTASFDVKGRVLTLPVWEDDMTEDVYDLLTGHEVGHALWTPAEDWGSAIDGGVNKNILNIVEDPRVDRKIKTRYPGLVKAYINGYRHLMDSGFFGNLEFEEMNILDRLNMHFKGGASLQVPFHPTEEWMVDMVAACETFDDVIEAAKKIQMAYAEDELNQDMSSSMDDLIFGGGDPMEGEGETSDGEELEDDMSSSKDHDPMGSFSVDEDDVDTDDFDGENLHAVDDEDAHTQDEYERRKQDLVKDDGQEIFYIGLPKPILKNLVIPHKACRTEIAEIISNNYETIDSIYAKGLFMGNDLSREGIMTSYRNFRQQSMKIVNYMVKEFERKKAADEYKRTSVAKTGMLNVNMLHAYKYSDDLFLKRAIVHDGKNHGMVMLVDWSASMTHNMEHTLKQLLTMIWFCNKVSIPYEVYAFTNCYRLPEQKDEHGQKITQLLPVTWEYKHGDAYFGETGITDFRLLNLVSSRMSAKDLNQQLQNLFHIGMIETRASYSTFDLKGYSLGSTPLVEAMVAMQYIIPNFRNYYKLDKVNFICLTDGEANSAIGMVKDDYNVEDRRDYLPIPNRAKIMYDDPMTRKVYALEKGQFGWRRYAGEEQVTFLVNLLRERYGINTIGIFLDGSARSIARRTLERYLGWYNYNREAHQKARKDCRRDGFATITTAGFNEYYIVPLGSMVIELDSSLPFEDGELADISKGKLKSIFSKNQKRKFGNRVLANRMMDLVA